jgi:serine protease Do
MYRKRIEMSRSLAILLLVGIAVAGGVAGSLATAKTGLTPFAATGGPVFQVAASTPLTDASSLAQGFHPVVKQTLPAVVNISTTKIVKSRGGSLPFTDPFFRDFFRDFGWQFNVPQKRKENSLGSGVIVSSDGYILTNNHVVSGATEIIVTQADKKEMKAKVVGTDPKTDIALLKVDEKDLPFLKLGDSNSVQVGDIVLAMGNPFGLNQTVTMGIVSATGRSNLNIEQYEDFIQTDAAINPGNSGGALVNVRGELIGINTAILSGGGGNQGIGFAIPSNMARGVMEQILKTGKVVRGWLGVTIQPVDPKMTKLLGLKEPKGALVGGVQSDSPAARAGIATGDVIVAVNGQFKIAGIEPGTKVSVEVIRDGQKKNIEVALGELPSDTEARSPTEGRTNALEGVEVAELTADIARQLGLPLGTAGVVVTSVDPSSAAAEASLQRGDVIQEVNRKKVSSVAAFERAVREAGDQPVLLLVNQRGNTRYIVIESQ